MPRAVEAGRRHAAPHDRGAGRAGDRPRPVHRQVDLPWLSPPLAERDGDGERTGASDGKRRRDVAPPLRLYAAPRPERATKARAEIEALYDERFFRMWEFYLAGGIVM